MSSQSHLRVKYHASSNVVVVSAPRAIGPTIVTVSLGLGSPPTAGAFSLTKGNNDNHVLSFTPSASNLAPVQLLVFRMEEDAKAALSAINRVLLAKPCPYQRLSCQVYAGLRVLLTVLGIIALLLVLSVVWKGYHSYDAYQSHARQPASVQQPSAGALVPPRETSSQVPTSLPSVPSPELPPSRPAPQDAYQIPSPQLPSTAPSSPQPIAQQPAKSVSPADVVINGLNGH